MFKLNNCKKKFFSNVRERFAVKVGNKETIGLEEYKSLRMNSYEAKLIEPILSDEALIWKLENAINNIGVNTSKYSIPSDYNEYILTDGINELLRRFKEKTIIINKQRLYP